jgi:hypothetical protein
VIACRATITAPWTCSETSINVPSMTDTIHPDHTRLILYGHTCLLKRGLSAIAIPRCLTLDPLHGLLALRRDVGRTREDRLWRRETR